MHRLLDRLAHRSPSTLLAPRRPAARLAPAVGAGLAAVSLAAAATVTPALVASASGVPTVAYTENGDPVAVTADVEVTSGQMFDGSTVDIAVSDASGTESLTVATVATPATGAGAVSVVGSTVYLGDGTSAQAIGTVTANGGALAVAFASPFANPSFESGDLDGWTPIDSQIDLGSTAIAGATTIDTSTYPEPTTNQDNNVPGILGELSTQVTTVSASDGTNALRLASSGMTTAAGYDVVHGPAVYSSPFEASSGDSIYFDWRAYAGEDNYHVFGYLLAEDGTQTELLDSTGGGTTSWATSATVIPATGTYRFVFVSGTFDASGGQAAGASLLIDNVKVYGSKVTSAVLSSLLGLVRYADTSDDPPASRTVTVTSGSPSFSGSVTVDVTAVDDPPAFGSLSGPAFTNAEGADSQGTATGTVAATDPDSSTLTYGLPGGTATSTVVGGHTYTVRQQGALGTLYLDAATGQWAFVPDDAAMDGRLLPGTEDFTVSATADGRTTTAPLTVTVAVPSGAPGAPAAAPTATAGDGSLALSWAAPAWWGGSAITGYVVETSLDGGATWTTAATVTGTSATVTGLTNGAAVQARVRAVNASGTSGPSAVVTATPVTTPSAPAVSSVRATSRALTITFAAPASNGGSPVTGYQYSLDGGATWRDAATTTSPLVVRNLTNGTTYAVQLRAVSAVGAGTATASVSATPQLAPTSTANAPQGSHPELSPGEQLYLVNGVEATLTVSTEDGTWTATSADGLTVNLKGVDASGDALELDADGRIIVQAGARVAVQGSGFDPGSVVDVWLFSTPVLLGQVTVGLDGSFRSSLPLPTGVVAGEHTVQLNGTSVDGSLRSVSAGVVVTAATDGLPITGTDPSGSVALTAALLVAGAALLAGRALARRRRAALR